MGKSVIKEHGRFRYIEPNDVLENNRYSKTGSEESFNITSPYEDYCIDVELTTVYAFMAHFHDTIIQNFYFFLIMERERQRRADSHTLPH